ncbi:MAG: DUF2271 domain-containing protein [Treponema sp.]|nr:DUF2271 domain-containing protein [Treponema sp.]
MMKKVAFFSFYSLIFSWILTAQSTPIPSEVEVSFVFNRQIGFSSNQYAVWIEDSQGNLVKTLFATKYTANGGWERRPQSIPIWVSKSALSTLAKSDIDAFSGATPRTGALIYRWDGTDKNGRALAGEYRVFLEATLRGENRVLYSATVNLGSRTEAETRVSYFGTGTRERRMIENVKVVYR